MIMPLIDESGEVRDMTEEDFKQFRPAPAVLPVSLQKKLGMSRGAGSPSAAPPIVLNIEHQKERG